MEAGRYSIAMAACEYLMLSEVVEVKEWFCLGGLSVCGLLCVDTFNGILNLKPRRIIASKGA